MTEQPVPPRLYKAYIRSALWEIKKWERHKLDRFICQGCGLRDWPLDCHHWTYDRLGEEEMGDLATLCRECHDLVTENDLSIVELRRYRDEHGTSHRISSEASILGLMLRKPVEMFQQFNAWLLDLGEERLGLQDFEPIHPSDEVLFEVGAYAAEATDESRDTYYRLIGWIEGVDLRNLGRLEAMRTDVIRTRMATIEWEFGMLTDHYEYFEERGELGKDEKMKLAAEAQELLTRKKRLDKALFGCGPGLDISKTH